MIAAHLGIADNGRLRTGAFIDRRDLNAVANAMHLDDNVVAINHGSL